MIKYQYLMHLFPSYFFKKGRARSFSLALVIAACLIFSALGFLSYGSRVDAAATLHTLRPTSNNLGLIALWSLDGPDVTDKVYDRSGQGNHAGFYGAATSTAKTAGKIGQALQFDGVDDYLDIPDIIEGLGAITAAAWVKVSDLSGNKLVVFNQTGGGRDPLMLEFAQGSGGNDFKYRCSMDNGIDNVVSSESVGRYIDTDWHHVACVYDGSQLFIYVDGVSVDPTPGAMTGVLASTVNNFVIGSTGVSTWAGQLDDIRIYNRALSAVEMKRLYASGGSKQQASQNNSLKDGLVGMWSFDGADITDKIYDRSGNGSNGTLIGTATSSAKVIGRIGQALQFDGVDDAVSIPNTSAINLTTAGSVSAWINIRTWKEADVVEKGGAGGYVIWTSPAQSNKIFFGRQNLGTALVNTLATFNTQTNKWIHVLGTYDGVTYKIYINGVLDNSKASVTGFSNSGTLTIGKGTVDGAFDGKIDDVRVYNRALSAAEAKRLYNEGAGNKQQASQNAKGTDGLVSLWSFDGADITDKVYDRGSNGYHGAFIGGATSSAKTIGKIGQALQFDGVDDRVSTGNTFSTLTSVSGTISVAAWVKLDTVATGYKAFTMNCTQSRICLSIATDANSWIMEYRSTGDASSANLDSNVSLVAGRWVHIVAVRDDANTRIYVNGVLANSASNATAAPLISSPKIAQIGAMDSSGSLIGFFPGKIDDVRVYSKALTSAEASRLYNMGR